MTNKISPHYHLQLKRLAFLSNRYIRSRCADQPVFTDVLCFTKHICSDLVKDLPLEGNRTGKYNVKCRDTIRSDHHQPVVTDKINITNFSFIKTRLIRKMKISHARK